MRALPLVVGTGAVLAAAAAAAFWLVRRQRPPLETVPSLDLQRYAGKWYEIARLPTWFEGDCYGTTACYTPDESRRGLKVLNRCYRGNRLDQIEGFARPTGKPGHLTLSLGFLRKGDYNVLMVDEDYRYALVGTRSRDNAWILARTPSLPGDVRRRFLAELRRQGFDADRLLWTEHPLEVAARGFPELDDEIVPI